MTGKNTTIPATPAATPSGVPVRLRSPAVIGNIDFAAGATVTVPPETADWWQTARRSLSTRPTQRRPLPRNVNSPNR